MAYHSPVLHGLDDRPDSAGVTLALVGSASPARVAERSLPSHGSSLPYRLPVHRCPDCDRHPDREALFAEFAPLVRRLTRQYGADDVEMRQDLAGEIYCRFCILLDSYDPTRGIPLRPYLVRQLTASTYTYARHHWRRRRREVCLDEANGVGATLHLSHDPSRDWDHQLAMEQTRAGLPEMIARLPARQRQVVIWRYYEARSFEEIAEVLGVRLATARSLLRHGLNNLRRWMAGRD